MQSILSDPESLLHQRKRHKTFPIPRLVLLFSACWLPHPAALCRVQSQSYALTLVAPTQLVRSKTNFTCWHSFHTKCRIIIYLEFMCTLSVLRILCTCFQISTMKQYKPMGSGYLHKYHYYWYKYHK